jgi:Tfp pilus assembly protein PilV
MKKFMRGVMFPVKKPFSGASAGLSLVEIVISVAVLLMLVVAASRIVQRNARMIDDSRQNTAASAIFQMMENRIKGMPFHDVYWFDSSNKAYIGSYPYLFQPWAINTSSKTLYYMEAEAAKRGFNRIRIESVYMRRDSSDMANNNRILEDSVEWRDTNADRCDDLDPSLCFRFATPTWIISTCATWAARFSPRCPTRALRN